MQDGFDCSSCLQTSMEAQTCFQIIHSSFLKYVCEARSHDRTWNDLFSCARTSSSSQQLQIVCAEQYCFLMKGPSRTANAIFNSFCRMLQADAQHSKRCTHCVVRCTEMFPSFVAFRNYEMGPHDCHSLCFGSHFEKVAFQTSRGCKHRSWTALCASARCCGKIKITTSAIFVR